MSGVARYSYRRPRRESAEDRTKLGSSCALKMGYMIRKLYLFWKSGDGICASFNVLSGQ